MKIAIWIPNLTKKVGGAETYCLNMAEVLSDSHSILIITSQEKRDGFEIEKIYDQFGVPHFETEFIHFYPIKRHDIRLFYWDRVLEKAEKAIDRLLQKYNIDFFINGTYGKLKGSRYVPSVHIIHFPANRYRFIRSKKLNERYIDSYNLYIANSKFTQLLFKEQWGKDSVVLNPPIKMEIIDDNCINKKENIIIAVDRLVPDKKIYEMIDAFKKYKKQTQSDYKFVIIGTKDDNYENYYNQLIKTIVDSDIEILSNLSFSELKGWYRKAKIFWHAKGYGEVNPFLMEHFGMTTVEAMANGCIPIVINKAGQIEIVDNSVNGFKWDSIDELISDTQYVTTMNEEELHKLQQAALEKANYYLFPAFKENLNRILSCLRIE